MIPVILQIIWLLLASKSTTHPSPATLEASISSQLVWPQPHSPKGLLKASSHCSVAALISTSARRTLGTGSTSCSLPQLKHPWRVITAGRVVSAPGPPVALLLSWINDTSFKTRRHSVKPVLPAYTSPLLGCTSLDWCLHQPSDGWHHSLDWLGVYAWSCCCSALQVNRPLIIWERLLNIVGYSTWSIFHLISGSKMVKYQ